MEPVVIALGSVFSHIYLTIRLGLLQFSMCLDILIFRLSRLDCTHNKIWKNYGHALQVKMVNTFIQICETVARIHCKNCTIWHRIETDGDGESS